METLREKLLEWGAHRAAIVSVNDIVFDRRFREQCASNACGCYGKNYMCPPDVGEIDELIRYAQQFDKALVFQTVTPLEDSYDFEGMMEAKKSLHRLLSRAREGICRNRFRDVLLLGGGACAECETCAKQKELPCRKPERAIPSLEAHGIAVSHLATLAGMNYINGQNTVTYFGAILYREV